MPVLRLGKDDEGVETALLFMPTGVAVVVTTVDNELVVVEGSTNSGGLESPSGPGGFGNGLPDLMRLRAVAIDGVGDNLGRGGDFWIFSLCAFLSFLDFDLGLLRKPSMLLRALTGVECGLQPDLS